MSKAKKSNGGGGDRLANARKIGQRIESITVNLSPMQVDDERAKVVALHREIDKAVEDQKNASAKAKAHLTDLRTRQTDHVRAATTARRDEEITIEEWLTAENEVIRVRTDTHEIVGARNARAEELQTDLPLAEGDAPEPDEAGL